MAQCWMTLAPLWKGHGFYTVRRPPIPRGVTRTGKDGKYVTEALPPGAYVVRVEGRDMVPVESKVTVLLGAAATADFKLEWINPGPVRLESKFSGDVPNQLPINGRNYLVAGQFEPGVQSVDGRIFEPGKSGLQSLSIESQLGRTTHFDMDEVEAMDETKGASILNLPADAVREVIVSRALPEVFQSLNASGAVRVTTRSGEDEWHGDLFGNFRDRVVGMAGFPSGSPKYSRQQYGFGAGGAVIKDKAFLFIGGERTKQDGVFPIDLAFPAFNGTSLQSAYFRENMVTARLDYDVSENLKWFVRFSYDNANEVGPSDSLSNFRNQINVPAAVVGLDWNRGRYVNSARFGYQKMVNAINPDLKDSEIFPTAPFHMQIGSYALGPSVAGPRQTIQRDLFGRYDGSTIYKVNHAIRFGGAIHRIVQGDYYAPGNYGPSVTSSNGLDVITAINGDPNLTGGADNPLNYPVGTVTIFNGLGNFSENSAFNRSTGGHFDTRLEGYIGDTFNLLAEPEHQLGRELCARHRAHRQRLGAGPLFGDQPKHRATISSVPQRFDSRSIRSDSEPGHEYAEPQSPVPRRSREPTQLEFFPAAGRGMGSGTQWADGHPREHRIVLRQFSAAERLSGSHQPLVEWPIQPRPDAVSDGSGAVSGRIGGEFRERELN